MQHIVDFLLNFYSCRIADAYFTKLTSQCSQQSVNQALSLKTVYTAMHGVGTPWIQRAFLNFGHKDPLLVEEQARPDPLFSTVSFPNPEEKGALDLAINRANAAGVGLIVARCNKIFSSCFFHDSTNTSVLA